jgi:uncharacterized protein YkwD
MSARSVRVFVLIMMLATPVTACEVPGDLSVLRGALLAGANTVRVDAALPALVRDRRLDSAAQEQACRMARRGATRLSHRGSWFAGLRRRLRREDYPYAVAVENLAAGQRDAGAVMAAWVASPEHRVNLLEPRLAEAGFGVARAENGWLYWSMVGAARRVAE